MNDTKSYNHVVAVHGLDGPRAVHVPDWTREQAEEHARELVSGNTAAWLVIWLVSRESPGVLSPEEMQAAMKERPWWAGEPDADAAAH